MQVIYAPETPPDSYTMSLFLAGPSPRNEDQPNWRTEALRILDAQDYDGVVFVPLPRDGQWAHGYDSQVEWETKYLNMADLVVFWIPRSENLPGLTTNVEYGMWFDTGKAILGYPEDATHMRYLDWHGQQEMVPVFHSLEETLDEALKRLDWGALRTGGEKDVPLYIWKTPSFQQWLKAQKGSGNRLDGAKVVWTFRVGKKKQMVFFWALHVDVFIKAENRHKTNEVVLARTDISTIVAYCAPDMRFEGRIPETSIRYVLETPVAIIKEYRSPASTPDAYIREIPGGSSWKPGDDPTTTAAHELSEETGLSIDPGRFKLIGTRQVAGTLSAHKAHVYACELSREEMSSLQEDKGVHGVEEDTERTYVEVHTLQDLLNAETLDWSNLGMILTTLLQA